jgi:thymidylate synthase
MHLTGIKMTSIAMELSQVRHYFKNELREKRFTTDKTGAKTIEMIGANFYADDPAIFGKPNQEYIEDELRWYDSQSTNITDIYPEGDKQPPQAWQYTANIHGEINSNYGHLIWSDKYHNQYEQVVEELLSNPDSRRASMIYQRPSIWLEYKEQGKNDFICTNAVTYYIRDDALHAVVQMRSNDVIFGYRNDYAWQKHVMDMLRDELYYEGIKLEQGDIYWQVQNLHVYERHFHLVK